MQSGQLRVGVGPWGYATFRFIASLSLGTRHLALTFGSTQTAGPPPPPRNHVLNARECICLVL